MFIIYEIIFSPPKPEEQVDKRINASKTNQIIRQQSKFQILQDVSIVGGSKSAWGQSRSLVKSWHHHDELKTSEGHQGFLYKMSVRNNIID